MKIIESIKLNKKQIVILVIVIAVMAAVSLVVILYQMAKKEKMPLQEEIIKKEEVLIQKQRGELEARRQESGQGALTEEELQKQLEELDKLRAQQE